MADELFDYLPEDAGPIRERRWAGGARVAQPDRRQVGWEMVDLDQLIGDDHRVRLVADFVGTLDLSPLYARIEARTHGPGRDAIDPALLLSLWLYATIDAVGSARELARLCARDLPYRWLCGGVGVNAHALSDFRSENAEVLDWLLTQSVTALVADGLVKLEVLAHDSVKVRASAGSASFRRAERLAIVQGQVAQRVKQLREELDGAADASARRKAAARLRAQADRLERLEKARKAADELKAAQGKRRKKNRVDPRTGEDKPVRASATDPDARILALSSGERRPAYSLQVTADPRTLVAVGLTVHDNTDFGQLRPAIEEIEARHGQPPDVLLADSGFCSKADISFAHQSGVVAIVPSNNEKKRGLAAYDTDYQATLPGIREWRDRMVNPDTRKTYDLRCRIECLFAQMRNRGLRLLHLRGRRKIKAEALIHLLAHNMLCGARLRLASAS